MQKAKQYLEIRERRIIVDRHVWHYKGFHLQLAIVSFTNNHFIKVCRHCHVICAYYFVAYVLFAVCFFSAHKHKPSLMYSQYDIDCKMRKMICKKRCTEVYKNEESKYSDQAEKLYLKMQHDMLQYAKRTGQD